MRSSYYSCRGGGICFATRSTTVMGFVQKLYGVTVFGFIFCLCVCEVFFWGGGYGAGYKHQIVV